MTILDAYYNAGQLHIGYTDGLHECYEIIEDKDVRELLVSEGFSREIRGAWANIPIPHEKGTPPAYQWLHLDNFVRENAKDIAERILPVHLKKIAV